MKKSDLPKVTVLMSVYNGAAHLAEAVQSVLQQTFIDFEFLIINDGSTDNSVDILKSYNDLRIRLVHNDKNIGLVSSLNRGLELASGEYIARMDADDISRPERLKIQVRFMDNNPSVGVCGSWVRFFPKPHDTVWKLPEGSDEIRCRQFYTVGVAHPSVMLRRRFFVEHSLLYDSQYRHIEDFELWSRAVNYMEFANIQKVLLDYRLSAEQICAKHRAEQLVAIVPLRLQRLRDLRIEPTPEEQLLHEMIMNGEVPAESKYLYLAEQWLMRLESANREATIYSSDCFSRMLLDVWFSVCISLAGVSGCSLTRCLSSPLWKVANASAMHLARAIAAWTVRVGLRETFTGLRQN